MKNYNIFGNEFYPTPRSVIDMMLIDCKDKICLEPSAGKGNIIDYLRLHNAEKIYACEIHPELSMIAKQKADVFLTSDCMNLTSEDIASINLIVMNPPFSQAKKHILHLYKIAQEGTEIKALVNADTISGYSFRGHELHNIIQDYGNIDYLENCFDNAERKTNVNIACITIVKPILSDNFDFEGFFLNDDDLSQQNDGIVTYNEVRSLVNKYLYSLKSISHIEQVQQETKHCEVLSQCDIGITFTYGQTTTSIKEMKLKLKSAYWHKALELLDVNRYVTSDVSDRISKFATTQKIYPFSIKNIYKMIEIIIATKNQNMMTSLVQIVNNFTRHTHENRYNVEGWKTNSGHMLNEKIIIDYVMEPARLGKLSVNYNYRRKELNDLQKILCFITGSNYENHTDIYSFVQSMNGLERGKWYSWSFFEIKGYNKGTLHLKFQNRNDWKLLNQYYCNEVGEVLPENM